MSEKKSGYTRLGFSKSFSCCGHHHICDMGRGPCIYRDIDPETMEGCAAYRRNKDKPARSVKESDDSQTEQTNKEPVAVQGKPEQLSLF